MKKKPSLVGPLFFLLLATGTAIAAIVTKRYALAIINIASVAVLWWVVDARLEMRKG